MYRTWQPPIAAVSTSRFTWTTSSGMLYKQTDIDDARLTIPHQLPSVAPPGLEPGRSFDQRILNPRRLPFRQGADCRALAGPAAHQWQRRCTGYHGRPWIRPGGDQASVGSRSRCSFQCNFAEL